MRAAFARATQPALPFAGICLLAFAATALRTADTNWTLVCAGVVVAAVVVGAACALRPPRVAAATLVVLPFVADGVIALLRQAQGGSVSGYAPLAVLPVVWVALTRSRRAVAAIALSTTALFAVPMVVVGAPLYPSTGWRAVVLWSVVVLAVGEVVHRVVSRERSLADLTASRAATLDQLIRSQTAIATADHDYEAAMTVIAAEALGVVGGDGACIELLEGDEVVCAGVAGTALPFRGLRLKADDTITGECFRTGRVMFCTDSEQDSRVAREACRTVGARSMIVIPLSHGHETKGVLIVWFSEPHEFHEDESQMLALLANTSGSALARSELVTQLTKQAATDDLTGLPNRRAWDVHLHTALARSRRAGNPLSVAVLDLDGFKQVNDSLGHAAGDKVLADVTQAWSGALRDSDVLGRIGGDEFAVILEEADAPEASEVLARLEAATHELIGTSAGFAVWDSREDAALLVARADADMYRVKAERSSARRRSA